MRVSTFTDEQAAAELAAARGMLRNVDRNNRAIVRKWLNAQGFPGAFTAGLSLIELRLAYNDLSGREIEKLRKKLGDDAADETTASFDLETNTPRVEVKTNGHAIGTDSTDAELAEAAQNLAEIISRRGGGKTLDEVRVREIARDEDKAFLDSVKQKLLESGELGRIARIEVKLPDSDQVKIIEGIAHPEMEDLLIAAASREVSGFHPNIWVAGPAGSGKTHGCKTVIKAMGLDCHFNGALSMAHELTGFRDAAGNFHPTAFYRAYGAAAGYIFDEVDGSDNSALLALNAALANGVAYFPDGPMERHKDSLIMATANTWGLGATADYVGRAKIDAAFMSRFPVRFFWDYDNELEQRICGNANWAKRVQKARAKARTAGIKVLIDPRASIAGAALIAAGMSEEKAAARTYLANLTPEQRNMVA